jgi:hypothetical protein
VQTSKAILAIKGYPQVAFFLFKIYYLNITSFLLQLVVCLTIFLMYFIKMEGIDMTKYNETHIDYHGESNGVHRWSGPNGQPCFWHPDWLHIAEDSMGIYPKEPLELEEGEEATKEHATAAIVKHINKQEDNE